MAQDIFVPVSKPEDALVGPLHTVTYITADRPLVERVLTQGYGMDHTPWVQPAGHSLKLLNDYFGLGPAATWEASAFFRSDQGRNVQVRVIHVDDRQPQVRPAYNGLYKGGATISCPMTDMRAHERVMAGLGVESTMGVKELEFVSPTGERYVSGEIVYKMPEHVFLMGVTRPDMFIPVGPIDAQSDVGGVAYSARCVTNTEAIKDFLEQVLGWEIRRDMTMEVGEQSAINLPQGVTERFIQAFAMGASSGYTVFMDHGEDTLESPAAGYGPLNRGIGVWSFATSRLDEVYRRAVAAGVVVDQSPAVLDSPFLRAQRTMLLKDPDGFPIEVFEPAD